MRERGEKFVQHMFEIAARAVEAFDAEHLAKMEGIDLNDAYQGFKQSNGLVRVESGSPEWDRMMAATSGEYASHQHARRKAYNAKRRLASAIQRYRNA